MVNEARRRFRSSLALDLAGLKLRLSLSVGLIVIWVLFMISIPIQRWLWGEATVIRAAELGVLLQAAAVSAWMAQVWGARGALGLAAGVIVGAWAIEWLGVTTGAPFGAYSYSDRLQPQVAGVPLMIPLAWLMMLPPSWAVAARILGNRRPAWAIALIGALAFTAWDLFLDPQMVRWGLWTWTTPGGYFGVPWTNFLGWFASAAALTLVLRPQPVASRGLLAIYMLTWWLESIALLFFWGLPGPAAAGCLLMGGGAFLAWRGSERAH